MNAKELSPDNNDPITDELTAYLDGELDAQSSREIERRLSHDAKYRQKLQELERCWDLLDRLPRADADPSFTQSTVAMIAVTAQEDVAGESMQRTRRRVWNWWAGLCASAAAFLIGYGAVTVQTGRSNRELLQDLPVIESIDEYRYVGDMQFLEMLDESGLFAEEEEIQDEL